MNNRTKYLLKNTALFALSNIGTRLINFFLVPLYTYVLSTEEYGTIDLVFTVCTIAVPILILNINESIMRFELDQNSDDEKILSVGFLSIGFSAIAGILLYFISYIYNPISQYRLYIYIYAITYGVCEIFICFLRGKEMLFEFALGNIIRTLSIAILNILFLVVYKLGVSGYLLAYIISNVITTIFSIFFGRIYRFFKHFNFDFDLFKKMVNYSFFLIPTSFMWWIINSSDRIMITYFTGIGISGMYAVSSKIPSLISVVSTIFNQAYSYSAIKEEKSEDKEEYNNKIFEYLFAFILLLGAVILFIIKNLIKLYVSENYFKSWYYTPPLILGTCIMVLATFFSVFYTVNKDSIGFLKSGTFGAFINIVLNLILIPRIGALGAAISTCISYFTVFIYRYIDTKKYITLKVFTIKNCIAIVLVTISSIAVYFNNHYTVCAIIIIIILLLYKKIWIEIIKSTLCRGK